MLSIPRTISRAVNVAKATQACGSLNHSIQNTYLLNLPRLQHGEDIRAKVRATVLFGQAQRLLSGMTSPSNDGLVILSKRCITRSEEHTSELQSRENLVCRLLLE